ncbi:MAG TPA: hypothetical protein VKZ63_05200 [Kofleriaceae bacterium]|nr:hypothetical protein [Kofleriaceae bacterium]
MTRAALALALSLALGAACGGGDGAADAGVIHDARAWTDAAVVACGEGADAGCESVPLTPVCSAERGVCVECTSDADCAARADALGPRCLEDPGYCQCERDEDCTGNPNGPRCHPIARACTCIDDGDCADPTTCELEPYLGAGVRTCR